MTTLINRYKDVLESIQELARGEFDLKDRLSARTTRSMPS